MHALLLAALLPMLPHSLTEAVDTPPPMWKLERVPVAPDAPAYTPYTIKPVLLNRAEVARALVRAYPRAARIQNREGRVLLWVYVDETGKVVDAHVQESAGRAFDSAAVAVTRVMRFRPARLDKEAVPVWIRLPVVFKPH